MPATLQEVIAHSIAKATTRGANLQAELQANEPDRYPAAAVQKTLDAIPGKMKQTLLHVLSGDILKNPRGGPLAGLHAVIGVNVAHAQSTLYDAGTHTGRQIVITPGNVSGFQAFNASGNLQPVEQPITIPSMTKDNKNSTEHGTVQVEITKIAWFQTESLTAGRPYQAHIFYKFVDPENIAVFGGKGLPAIEDAVAAPAAAAAGAVIAPESTWNQKISTMMGGNNSEDIMDILTTIIDNDNFQYLRRLNLNPPLIRRLKNSFAKPLAQSIYAKQLKQ